MFDQMKQILFSLTLLSFIVFCPGAMCGPITPPGGDPPPTSFGPEDNTSDPAITGFSLAVEQGAYWQFAWDTKQVSFGSGETITRLETGVFRIVLGAPRMIQGIQSYELIFEGRADRFTPRWRYLAFRNHQILGSVNGVSLNMIFDGLNGYWPASGLFVNFPINSLISTTSEDIDNAYISMPAIAVKTSSSKGGCEYYPGVGTICPGETNESSRRTEYYAPGIGPVGFYEYGSFSSRSGGATTETHCGLMEHSFQPVEGLVPFEREPNDSPSQAQYIQIPSGVVASIEQSDAGSKAPPSTELTALSETLNSPGFVNSIYADWFTFTLDTNHSTTVGLDFFSTLLTDIDIVLFDETLTHILGYSTRDNIRAGGKYETITVQLEPGTYYVGVLGFLTSNRVNYTLRVQ